VHSLSYEKIVATEHGSSNRLKGKLEYVQGKYDACSQQIILLLECTQQHVIVNTHFIKAQHIEKCCSCFAYAFTVWQVIALLCLQACYKTHRHRLAPSLHIVRHAALIWCEFHRKLRNSCSRATGRGRGWRSNEPSWSRNWPAGAPNWASAWTSPELSPLSPQSPLAVIRYDP